jgi:hypothetical protein
MPMGGCVKEPIVKDFITFRVGVLLRLAEAQRDRFFLTVLPSVPSCSAPEPRLCGYTSVGKRFFS